MKVVMQQFDCTSCPRLPTYTVVQSGLFSGFSLLPASWLASIAAEYNQANGKISSEEDPYWLKFLSLIMWHVLHLMPIIQYKHGKACSAGRKRSWIIYCWLVWCERKILFQLIIHDRIRASEQVAINFPILPTATLYARMLLPFIYELWT